MTNSRAPVFIGGTGRSGTSILAKFLSSHADIIRPCDENKLIVEDRGLRTIVEKLAGPYNFKGNDQTIKDFLGWARVLRREGFHWKPANLFYRGTNNISRKLSGRAFLSPEAICRAFPFLGHSMTSVGQSYGLDHYDACVDALIEELVEALDEHGLFDTEGLVQPVYMARRFERNDLLTLARDFLEKLNAPKLAQKGATRWCDDTPANCRYVPFLTELYPESKVIHIVRDPRDVVASYLGMPWASNTLDYTVDRLAHDYRTLIEIDAAAPVASYLQIRLEDFVNDHVKTLNLLAEFLQLDPDGFDGSVQLCGASFGRWRKAFAPGGASKIEAKLDFAISHYGYK